MISKDQLKELIKTIKSKTGLSQELISEKAGYERKTLTQLMSGGAKLDEAYNQLKMVFADELKSSTSGKKKFTVQDPLGLVLENQIELLAAQRVILAILAESSAGQKGRPVKEFENIFRQMVKDEAEQVRAELRQRS